MNVFNNKLINSESLNKLMDKFTAYDGVIQTDMNSLTEKSKKLGSKIQDIQSVIEKESVTYKNKYAQLDSYLGTLNGNLTSVTTLMGNLNITA